MTEKEWDKKFNIDTCGRDASKEDDFHYPYEPTPYCVLERLVESEYISNDNIVIDYGCGKGRVPFFFNQQLDCKVIGIDFDERMCEAAQKNKVSYEIKFKQDKVNLRHKGNVDGGSKLEFFCQGAEKYKIIDADRFYFFNPFSVEVLKSVIGKIQKSYFDNPREMLLFFYYPSDEYVSYLMTVPELCFVDEIDCQDLFEGNNIRERIVIFEMM